MLVELGLGDADGPGEVLVAGCRVDTDSEAKGRRCMATRGLAIPVFDDVGVLDFCGASEVFSVGSRFANPPVHTVLLVAIARFGRV